MSDITMCKGGDCQQKKSCHRHTAIPNEYRQAYFMCIPLKEDGTCDHFFNNQGWKKYDKTILRSDS